MYSQRLFTANAVDRESINTADNVWNHNRILPFSPIVSMGRTVAVELSGTRLRLAGDQQQRRGAVASAQRGAQSADLNRIAQRRACAMHRHQQHSRCVDAASNECRAHNRLLHQEVHEVSGSLYKTRVDGPDLAQW